jgi:hypothetical protein
MEKKWQLCSAGYCSVCESNKARCFGYFSNEQSYYIENPVVYTASMLNFDVDVKPLPLEGKNINHEQARQRRHNVLGPKRGRWS